MHTVHTSVSVVRKAIGKKKEAQAQVKWDDHDDDCEEEEEKDDDDNK